MIKYIKAEFYRTFHSPLYKKFLAFCVGVMLVILGVWKPLKFSDSGDFMVGMCALALVAIILVISIAMTIAYKTKDTKVQILSYGMTRGQMYFYDLITMQAISLVTTIILGLIALATGFVANLLGLASVTHEAYIGFIAFVLRLILYSINLNNAIFGLGYLLNSVPLGLIGHIVILPALLQIATAFTIDKDFGPYIMKFLKIQPYIILQDFASDGIKAMGADAYKIIGAGVIYVIVCFLIPGYLAFKNREIY
ncbi:hypothetical protein [Neofamilia massiliensis]|uniref:hypothetical protein n=1 Tax=Neofamilia massiliensis TaxID=1673724 RepID=UPI0006BB5D69|nr:hypothetical protein [Neofamilia massiliensis]